MLVKQHLRTQPLHQWHRRDAQAIAVAVEGVMLVSFYDSNTGVGGSDVQQLVLECLSRRACGAPWLLAGDHNNTPGESPMTEWLLDEACVLLALQDEEGNLKPTRHGGNRAIDYGITNHPASCHLEGEVEEVIADHLVLLFRVLPPQVAPVEDACCLERATSLAKPETCSLEDWQARIAHQWNHEPHPVVGERLDQHAVDALWEHFSNTLECVLLSCKTAWYAEQHDSEHEVPRLDGRVVAKNRVNLYRTPVAKGTRRQPWASFRKRKLQKLAHRLSELVRLEQLGRRHLPEYEHVWRVVSRFPGLPRGTVLELHTYVLNLLERFRKDEDATRVRLWREKLRSSEKACFRWVRDAGFVPAANVKSRSVPELGVSRSVPEALRLLAAHWSVLWERDLTWRENLRKILAVSPRSVPWEWTPVGAQDLIKEAAKLKGKSASVDGWLGQELCDLPPCVFERVACLFHEFEKSGLAPSIWQHARQVHIPKAPAVGGVHEAYHCVELVVPSVWLGSP